MNLSERIHSFVQLGNFLKNPENKPEIDEIAYRAQSANPWFIPANTLQSLGALATEFLDEKKLSAWTKNYNAETEVVKSVGVVMAGNIPAVGFHDLLSVLISGHRLIVKPSSQDFVLINYLIKKIIDFTPTFADRVVLAERMNHVDAMIATGSDNTARYFEYYFAKKPHIIRKNRTSVAILTGQETDAELLTLGHDMLDYYGLGCRNVSALFVPPNYDFVPLLRLLEPQMSAFTSHHKYNNNYDYNRSIYLVNRVPHFDNGFLLLTENETLVSPISVCYYQTYTDANDLSSRLATLAPKIQCMVSQNGQFPGSIPFGQTQRPGLTDYADGVDTMAFLQSLG